MPVEFAEIDEAAAAREAVALMAETRFAPDLLRQAFDFWGDRLVLCTAFQAEGMVLLDMCVRIFPRVRVLTVDTGRLPEATHGFMEQVKRHYGIRIEVCAPDPGELSRLVAERGPNAFYNSTLDRRLCCHIRKVRSLAAYLSGRSGRPAAAWIAGLRRDQAPSRAALERIAADEQRPELYKLAPLADWTEREVENYARLHNVPRHPLYAQGYRSIGCAPCTRAIAASEDARDGRWWWENGEEKECGLHFQPNGHVARAFDVALRQITRSR